MSLNLWYLHWKIGYAQSKSMAYDRFPAWKPSLGKNAKRLVLKKTIDMKKKGGLLAWKK